MKSIHIGRRDICEGLIGAGITAIVVGLAGCGPWRYQAAPFASGYNAAAGCYILDTWTGRAELWLYGDEQPMRTVRQQRRDLSAKIRAEARHERDSDGTDCLVIKANGYADPVLVAPGDLEAFVEAHPDAIPVR